MDKKIWIVLGIIALLVLLCIIVVGILLLLGGIGLLLFLGGVSAPGSGPICYGTSTNLQLSHIVYSPASVAINLKNLSSGGMIENVKITLGGDGEGTVTETTMPAGSSNTYDFGGDFHGPYSITVDIEYTTGAGIAHREKAECRGTY